LASETVPVIKIAPSCWREAKSRKPRAGGCFPKSPGKEEENSLLAGALVLIALALIGVELRSSKTRAVRQSSQAATELAVTVVHPQKASITIPALPGQTEAYTDAPIHAQTSGYLKNWYFDIGAKVTPPVQN
jgi:multidrug efflux pump subunit AcrA (membrane-fusion protein)